MLNPVSHRRASSSLSQDGSQIIVSNLAYGFDVYDLSTSALILTIPHDVKSGYPPPVQYMHGGRAVALGSAAGRVTLRYVEETTTRKLQTLVVPGTPLSNQVPERIHLNSLTI